MLKCYLFNIMTLISGASRYAMHIDDEKNQKIVEYKLDFYLDNYTSPFDR